MSYESARQFADSWGLLFMGLTFLVLVGWAFRRGAGDEQEQASRMIFDPEERDDG